jgi:heparan-alpha-glucosaminide N-acetyltransferase
MEQTGEIRVTAGSKRPPGPRRLASLDAYRGFVMLLMMAEVLKLCAVSAALPDSGFWRFLCYHQSHVEWVGCSLHDLIQPSFSFLVGVVLPFSIAKRLSSGQTFRSTALHAAIRSFVLIVLGIAILSLRPAYMIWKFEDTLTQIGLCYFPLFLLAYRSPREWWLAFAVILAGYWLAFALYPLPGPDFDYAKVGVSSEWLKEHGLTGFAAHWQKNSNIALAFDDWFLPLFPGNSPYISPKGLVTLNFVPLFGTMILGLIAGDVLRSARDPWAKVRWFFVAGGTLLATGWSLGALGICPVVKSIWTPSWVLFSGGWCFLILATFYAIVDICEKRRIAFPLIVIGMNSIAAYVLANTFQNRAFNSLRRIFGPGVFSVFGDAYYPLVYGLVVLVCLWLVLFAMYRRKLFLRI